ncbi:penicillin-binding transpeptidase domain-containing protein [Clostridium hydrogeniformans]|uniref:penicillin-binding transpeptidase domain-containing protein n=1 Tax=Clostridium hydrogeniformans TaxID=349933 RepID=UPI00068B5264|nr:penicillin-binding transpeptidase domain-containing protein [Clostridium hydrogeniformans]
MKKKRNLDRYNVLIVIMLVIFSIIIVRLFYVQVINYDNYKELAANRSIKQIAEVAPRGMILDSTGSVLAKSEQSYMVVYMETKDNKAKIFDTLTNLFKVLDETGETLVDEFALKTDPYRLEFKSSDPDVVKAMEIRFKLDRGFDEAIKRRLFKNVEELTDEQKEKVNEELLKITPEEVFDKLIKDYELYRLLGMEPKEAKDLKGSEIKEKLLEKYSLEEIRKYVLVRDNIKMQMFTGYKPVVLSSNIKKESAFIFLQRLNEMPGIDINIQPIRYYPYKDLASSVIGYIGSINSSQKERYEERGYDVSVDTIGKSGIESAFENRLKGAKGGTVVKVNKEGRKTEELFRLDPAPGQNIHLALRKDLQYTAEKALEDTMLALQKKGRTGDGLITKNATRGSVVVSEVNTGKILAMASKPGFDPNDLAVPGRLTEEQIKEYFSPDLEKFGQEYIKKMGLSKTVDDLFPKDERVKSLRQDPYDLYPKPFFNYATQGVTAPGSIYKPLTAIAGLETGVISAGEVINDKGFFNDTTTGYKDLKGFKGKNDGGYAHGATDMRKAIAKSSNYYFFEVAYRLGKQMGIDKLAEYAWKFGLGSDPTKEMKSTTGIEIEENIFGQTYNLKSNRESVALYSIIDVVDKFKQGSFGRSSFKGMDIGKSSEDSDDVANAKEAIKESIRKVIGTAGEKDENFNDVSKEFKEKIKAFIETMPEDEQATYMKQLDAMTYDLTSYIIFDVRNNIDAIYNVLNAAIGQGINQFTPLQMVNFIATVANGGTRYRTHLVDKITDSTGKVIEEVKPQVLEKVEMSDETIRVVKEGMYRTVKDGTAGSLASFPIDNGGKTGSATFKEDGKQDELGRTSYATYVGFAPLEKPEIAVTVVIYDGGHGGEAVPVARAIYEQYFKEELDKIGYKPMYNYKLPE